MRIGHGSGNRAPRVLAGNGDAAKREQNDANEIAHAILPLVSAYGAGSLLRLQVKTEVTGICSRKPICSRELTPLNYSRGGRSEGLLPGPLLGYLIEIRLLESPDGFLETLRVDKPIGIVGIARLIFLVHPELRRVG